MSTSSVIAVSLCALLSCLVASAHMGQRSLEGYRPVFRFPGRPKIINNQFEEPIKPTYTFVQHQPNPMLPIPPLPQYGPIVLGSPVDCVCPCTKEYLPLCGSDGRSYGNNCLFECQRKCDRSLRFKFCGTCEEPREDLKLPCF